MKPAGVKEIKEELKTRSREELTELCLNLSKFKKENKELLTYLLFEAGDENYFIQGIKEEILRNTKKNIRYSKKKQTEVELIIFFCKMLKEFSPSITKSIPLTNIFEREIQRVKKIILTLDPDLQYDYGIEIEEL